VIPRAGKNAVGRRGGGGGGAGLRSGQRARHASDKCSQCYGVDPVRCTTVGLTSTIATAVSVGVVSQSWHRRERAVPGSTSPLHCLCSTPDSTFQRGIAGPCRRRSGCILTAPISLSPGFQPGAVARDAFRPAMALSPPPTEPKEVEAFQETMFDDEPSWLTKLRRSLHSKDWVAVARIVMAIGGSKDAEELHRVLAEESTRKPGNPSSFCTLLQHLRTSDTPAHHAVELFRMVEPWFRRGTRTVSQWNVVLMAFIRAGRIAEALELVRQMELGEDESMPPPDQKTYTMLMLAIAEHQGTTASASLLARISSRGLEPDGISYLFMVVMHVRSVPPNMEAAKHWLRKAEYRMLQENKAAGFNRGVVCLYNTMMSGYTKLGMLKDAFSVLGCLRARSIKPDSYTFQILMHACMQYSPYGVQECRQLLRVMQQMGVEPTTANYNVLIRGYGLSGQLTSALRIANRMREAGVPWNRYTYYYLISAVVTAGQVELSLRLLAKMRRDGVRPTSMHYTIAFVGLARAGFYDDAGRVFRRLTSINNLAAQYAYNMMIAINCQRGDMREAVEVQQGMESVGYASNALTYRILLQGYARARDWDAVLSLQDDFLGLRRRLTATVEDGASTPAARNQALVSLQDPDEVRNWTLAYHFLIEAATAMGDNARAVKVLEDMVEQGLPINIDKHAALLDDAEESVRFKFGGAHTSFLPPPAFEEDEEMEQRRTAQTEWVRRVPRMRAALTAVRHVPQLGAQANAGSPPAVRRGQWQLGQVGDQAIQIPPHLFCASFDPSWLQDKAQSDRMSGLFERCLAGEPASYQDCYRAIHDHHHATVHLRELASVRLPTGHVLIGRTAAETIETLQDLFSTFGEPGKPNSASYVFMRPSAASFDAHIALLAAGALYPDKVLLVQSEEIEAFESLSKECQSRGARSLSYAIVSSLENMPAAALLNSKVLIAHGRDLEHSEPEVFESELRSALFVSSGQNIVERAQGSGPAAWQAWLRQHQLRQLIRCDKETDLVRLDGTQHLPAISQAPFFSCPSI